MIKETWKLEVPGNLTYKLCKKQVNTATSLKMWNRNVFGHYQTQISRFSMEIAEVQKKEVTETNAKLEAKLQNEMEEWLRRNELLWRQKSREMWLKDGDKNSRFFHLSTIIWHKRNAIDVIKDDEGTWLTNKKDIRGFVIEKFSNIFTEESVDFPPDLDRFILPSISNEANSELGRIPLP